MSGGLLRWRCVAMVWRHDGETPPDWWEGPCGATRDYRQGDALRFYRREPPCPNDARHPPMQLEEMRP